MKRNQSLVTRKHEGKMVVFNPETGKVFLLNKTAHMILDFCDGNRNLNEIARLIAEHFQIDMDLATKDIKEILEDFKKAQIIF